MKKTLDGDITDRTWSLISNITYAIVPSWYGCSCQNLQISLVVPRNIVPNEAHPVLVWFCGGAFQVVDNNIWIPQWLEFAKRNNYIFASVSYRTTNDAAFPAQLEDAKAAIRFLRAHATQFAIDDKRIIAMGESAGGTIAALLGVYGKTKQYDVGDYLEYSSNVQGVVDFYGITEFDDTEMFNFEKNSWIREFLGKTDSINKSEINADVIKNIEKNTPPFVIFHGDNDSTVPIKMSLDLYDKLCEFGIVSDFYVVKGAGHGTDEFYQPQTQHIIKKFVDAL